jgi:hypothetical protein
VIPGVKGSESPSEKELGMDYQSRPAAGPSCSSLIPQFPAMSPAPVQVCRKAKNYEEKNVGSGLFRMKSHLISQKPAAGFVRALREAFSNRQ